MTIKNLLVGLLIAVIACLIALVGGEPINLLDRIYGISYEAVAPTVIFFYKISYMLIGVIITGIVFVWRHMTEETTGTE